MKIVGVSGQVSEAFSWVVRVKSACIGVVMQEGGDPVKRKDPILVHAAS